MRNLSRLASHLARGAWIEIIEHMLSDHTSDEEKNNLRKSTEHYELIAALPEIIKNGVMVEEHADNHGKAKRVYRIICPVSIDGADPVPVKLTLKYERTGYVLDDGEITNIRAYDESFAKEKEPEGRSQKSSQEVSHGGSYSDSSEMIVADLLKDVKDNEGNNYLENGILNVDFSQNTNSFGKGSLLQEATQMFQVSPAEFERQKAEIRKQYEGSDQWMKAPNGEPTNLTEDQWVTVRTPAFKNWFGNWEAPIVKEKLTNGEMIKVDDAGTVVIQKADENWKKLVTDYANNKKGAQNKLIQFIRAYIPETITGTKIGDVDFSNNSIRNSLHHGHGRANAIVLPYIEKILQSAEKVGIRQLEDGKTSHVLANAIEYNGQRFIIIMVVNEDA